MLGVLPMKRAALYMRVSSVDQRPESQRYDLQQLASQRGYEIVKEYTDKISGAKARRPALDELLADARRRRFDVVVVWAFDRMARSVRHFLEVLDELNQLNIEFVSYRENIDGDVDASHVQSVEELRHKFGDGHNRQVAVTRISPAGCALHLVGDEVGGDFIRAAGVGDRSGCEARAAEPERHRAPLRFERLGQLQLAHGLQSHMQKMLGGCEIGVGKRGPGIVRDVLGK